MTPQREAIIPLHNKNTLEVINTIRFFSSWEKCHISLVIQWHLRHKVAPRKLWYHWCYLGCHCGLKVKYLIKAGGKSRQTFVMILDCMFSGGQRVCSFLFRPFAPPGDFTDYFLLSGWKCIDWLEGVRAISWSCKAHDCLFLLQTFTHCWLQDPDPLTKHQTHQWIYRQWAFQWTFECFFQHLTFCWRNKFHWWH